MSSAKGPQPQDPVLNRVSARASDHLWAIALLTLLAWTQGFLRTAVGIVTARQPLLDQASAGIEDFFSKFLPVAFAFLGAIATLVALALAARLARHSRRPWQAWYLLVALSLLVVAVASAVAGYRYQIPAG